MMLEEAPMPGQLTRRWFGFGVGRSFVFLLFTMFLAACSGDACSSCDCEGFVVQDFPEEHYDKSIQQSGQIRVTGAGLDFVEQNLPAIVAGALPTGLNFCVPESSGGGFDVCYNGEMCQGAPGCELELTIDGANIEPVPGDSLNVSVTIGSLDETLSITTGFTGDCTITLHKDGDQSQPGTITATVPVTFSVEESSPTRDVRIRVGEIDANLDDVGFDIDGRVFSGCNLIDAVAGIGFVENIIKDQLRGQLDTVIEDFGIEEQLCRACTDVNGCPTNATCDNANATMMDPGICRFSNNECVPRTLGVEGQLQLGSVLGDVTQHPESAVDLMVKVADTAQVDTGVTLGLRSAYQPDAFRRCVPVDPTTRPSFDTVPLSPSVTGETHPVTGQPFHIGIGYHERAIEQVLWSLWSSGVFCLEIDSSFSELLSTGALGAFLPSLNDLADGASAVRIMIVPQEAPEVALGANTVTPDGMSYTIQEGLLTLDWKDLDIHIYAFVQDRWTRATTLRADLVLPIAIVPDGNGSIVPVIGDFENAISNIRPVAPELLAEDPQRLIDLVPTLLGFALPSLTGDLISPIEIPEFVGLRIDIDQEDVTSVDNNTMIAIFANFEVVMMPFSDRVNLLVGNHTVDYSRWTPSGLVKPMIELDVMPLLPPVSFDNDLPVEYQYRVDGGLWSLFEVPQDKLEIEHPLLLLEGEHTIEVRARYRGIPESTTTSPVQTTVRIDYTAPTVELDRNGDTIAAEANDFVDHAADLHYRFRIVGDGASGDWTAWSHDSEIDLASTDVRGTYRVEVEVRDLAGHVGSTEATFVREAAIPGTDRDNFSTLPADGTTMGGCSTGGNSSPGGLLVLLLLGGFFFAWRRRPRGFVIAFATAMALSGCDCGDDNTASDTCPEECEAGFTCVDGECVASPCETDEECPSGFFCSEDGTCAAETCEMTCDATCDAGQFGVCSESGECSCENYCADGCDGGSFCCFDSNSCQALPDPCAEEVCEPGFEPVAQDPGSGDSQTCEVTVGTCACEPLPPLDIGWHGHYASIAVGGGIAATAVYNSTYEDLMVGIVDESLEPTWFWVDGVPTDAPVIADPSGPRGGIRARGPEMGKYTSTVVDDAGTIHVFYQDGEELDLKYARGDSSGAFEFAILDSEGATGYWTSAQLLGGNLHVVYTTQVSGSAGAWGSELRYISFAPDAALDSLAPTPEVLDSTGSNNPCGFQCGSSEFCFPSEGACLDKTRDCEPDCGDGQECLNGACLDVIVQSPPAYAEATGQFNELTLNTEGGLLLTYYNGIENTVYTAESDGTTWGMPSAIAPAPAGPYVSGTVDAMGVRHFAYMDPSQPALVYTSGGNTPEVIQDGTRDRAEGWVVTDIGEDVSLRANADGSITALYHDATTHALRQATRDMSGMWTVTEVAGYAQPYTGAHGFYTQILPVTGTSLAVEFVIDQQQDPTAAYPVFRAP
jgi:MYXO-CTERM domain-containing protein